MRLTLSTNFIQRLITAIILGLGFWAIFIYFDPIYFSLLLGFILILIILFEWKRLFAISTPAFWLTMPLYPMLPFSLLIIMNQNPLYRPLLLILFVIVFSFDTGAYIIGSLFGKHKIWPAISAHKSWEGVIGGFLFALVGLRIALYEEELSKSWYFILLFTLIVCALSLTGDFFESWLKRRAHIKDSGNLLPGHGGFLDRFDGILFAVFFFYLLRNYLLILLYA